MSISFSYQNSDCFSTCFSSYSSLFSFLVYFFVNTCKNCVRQVNIYGTVHQHNIHNTPLKVCDIGFFAIRIAEGNVVIDTKGKFVVWDKVRWGNIIDTSIHIYEYSKPQNEQQLVLFHIIYTCDIYLILTHIFCIPNSPSCERQSILFFWNWTPCLFSTDKHFYPYKYTFSENETFHCGGESLLRICHVMAGAFYINWF